MKKEILRSEIILLGAALFNFIFWNENLGINTLIFTIFIVSGLWFMERDSFQTRSVRITAMVAVLLSCLVVWHNSLIVKTIYCLNFSVMIGLIQERQLRFLGSAILLYVTNLFTVIQNLFTTLKELPILRGSQKFTQGLKLAILPAFILPIFYGIYYLANPKFAALSGQFWTAVANWLSFDWNPERILFFVMGLLVVGAAFLKNKWLEVLGFEQDKTDTLIAENYEERPFKLFDFDENSSYRSAMMLMISLNILLVFNNLLDFNYVWLGGAEVKTAVELKQYVHEGTYILIVGIVLALVVLMVLYKGSLNFTKNSEIWSSATSRLPSGLRGLSFAWLVQNAVLAVSVGMRNWQYIDHYGLAYKRIGVFLFLSLVLYGLYLMYLKINEKRTLFFFISRGAWAIYAVMVAACFINWDVFITKYNLTVSTKTQSVDVPFLVKDISDKNLYLLYENRDRLIEKMPNKPFDENEYWESQAPDFTNKEAKIAYLDYALKQKRANFEGKTSGKTWLSWNYPDYRNAQSLK
jgi:Domain of unknown function (DUF4173)